MLFSWASVHCASALFPSSLAIGEEQNHAPPHPPDPPDPVTHLFFAQYLPLSPVSTVRSLASTCSKARPASQISTVSKETSSPTNTEMVFIDSCIPQSTRSESPRSEVTVAETLENFTVFPPKTSSPLLTDKASAPSLIPLPSPSSTGDALPPQTVQETIDKVPPPPGQANSQQNLPPKPSLVEKIRRFEDKTLQRLAPTNIYATGRPTVLIPDVVFQKRCRPPQGFHCLLL
ncbi:hypothetical protein Bca4012_026971 [Brassica carinata]